MEKRCSKCKRVKNISEFVGAGKRTRLAAYCRVCHTEKQKEWNKNNPEKIRARWRRYYKKHREEVKTRAKDLKRRIRQETIAHYGGRCVCCGEVEFSFLTLDHIIPLSLKTNYERKDLAGWLKQKKYPPGFQVLCWNCNMAKRVDLTCPHAALWKNGKA